MQSLGLDLDIRHNIKEFTGHLDSVQRKQIPYATSLAINGTAFDVRDALVAHTRAAFNNRKAWYRPAKNNPVGIKVTKSHKKKRMVASVHTAWTPAKKHEEGGMRVPFRGKALLVPSDRVPKSRRIPGGASQYLAQGNVFSTPRGVFRRVGGKRSKRLELLYWKVRRASIKPTYGWGEVGHRVTYRNIERQFNKALAKALRTAK